MIKFYVGTNPRLRKMFIVHKKLFCAKSEHFKAMFDGGFEESVNGLANFPEDDPKSFGLLIGWFYTSKVPPVEKQIS